MSSKYSSSPILKGIGTTVIPKHFPSSGVIPEPESVQIPIFMPTPLYCPKEDIFLPCFPTT